MQAAPLDHALAGCVDLRFKRRIQAFPNSRNSQRFCLPSNRRAPFDGRRRFSERIPGSGLLAESCFQDARILECDGTPARDSIVDDDGVAVVPDAIGVPFRKLKLRIGSQNCPPRRNRPEAIPTVLHESRRKIHTGQRSRISIKGVWWSGSYTESLAGLTR